MLVCPECENDIDVDQTEMDEGEVVSCPECGSDFEVVGVEPLELSKLEEADEDEDKEEESEDDDEY